MAIGSDGTLREGPALKEWLTTPSTFVWSVAASKSGAVFLGTGSPATVLRVEQGREALHAVREQGPERAGGGDRTGWRALCGDGAERQGLQAGCQPQQRRSMSRKRRWCSTRRALDGAAGKSADGVSADKPDTRSHYIWDLTFDTAGRLYIATGGPGAVYRVDVAKPGSKPELFFKSDEQHIRALAWDAKGNLIAGSDGSGLVYRISSEGKGYVLFEAPRREITSVAVGDGRHDLRGERRRQEPQSPASAAGARDRVHHDHDCATWLAAGGEREHVGTGGNRNLRAEGWAGTAQGVVEQGRYRVCAGRADRWRAGAERKSRPHLSHSGKRRLLRMWHISKRSRVCASRVEAERSC